jgi:hypothetical protein
MGPTFESTIRVCAIDDSIFLSVGSLPHLPDMLTSPDVDSGDSTVLGGDGGALRQRRVWAACF